ncbi:heme oxygenase (biliverdin-producing) [Brevibacterium ammoniilyticum]|uniref:Heme oxygenase (Biliverdin-producing) n=1 Tax=Brevibacterium ammoniilyticum TaxID=1046555 RepID=A0ABP9U2E0_9MICO
MTEKFSARLRQGTATIHDDVEHTDFMVDLMEGRLDAEAYATLLTQYEVIYAALEERARAFADDPVFAAFHDPRLERHARIVADLAALNSSGVTVESGPGSAVDSGVVPSARDYALRLSAIATPEAMIAHHYTRYLGDLSGGQAIGTLMARHYGIGAEALTMWDFSELGKTKPYKDDYRSRLDEIAATGGDEQAVLDEAIAAFEVNGALLGELTRERAA